MSGTTSDYEWRVTMSDNKWQRVTKNEWKRMTVTKIEWFETKDWSEVK